ncbi:MAG: hypothetical protein O2923_01835 [Verrucomicrobia bacterium]|nr:hypothetical protein [Verrucomicrobiota bacterium]
MNTVDNNSITAPGVRRRHSALVLVAALVLQSTATPVVAADDDPTAFQVRRNAQFSEAITPRVLHIDLRDLPKPRPWQPGDPIRDVPRRHNRRMVEPPPPEPRVDPLLAQQAAARPLRVAAAFDTPILNFTGQGFSGAQPPDTVGDVGLVYYIQAINGFAGTSYAVFNKNDGSVAAGPFTLSDLGGAGGCASGGGDPIVLYDSIADRWLLTEFASFTDTLCVYVSMTADPISGGWYNYQFNTPNFPDYPKYGVWPDAYYVSANENSPSLYALDRASMLTGAPATFQRFTVSALAGFNFQALTPCDLDGATPPPGGAPNYFMRHRDDEAHTPGSANGAQDFLEMFSFHVDWATPGNSTVSGPVSIAVSEFESDLCGLTSFSCFPQPGTGTTLDPLREVIMQRLQYRNFGSHQTLVGSFVTDVDGTEHGGVRWFELRKIGAGAWALHQEGTLAPDIHNRWMSSIAMDGSGNIAVGYNISSSTLSPGLRYSGRLAGDPSGTMPQGEHTIGGGAAANTSNRYGDYSAMSVDPADDCTFWFTGEYNLSSSWATRIASFTFDSCGCPAPSAPTNLTAVQNGDRRIDVAWDPVPSATDYSLFRSLGSCPQSSPTLIASNLAATAYSDTNVVGSVTYSYAVTVATNADCESALSACVDVTATGLCDLDPVFAGVQGVVASVDPICHLRIMWDPATAPCGGPLVYNVYRSTNPGFTPGPANMIATCLSSTQYIDQTVSQGVTYSYNVRAEDLGSSGSGDCSGGRGNTNLQVISGSPSGNLIPSFEDDLESGVGGWVISALPADTGTLPWFLVDSSSHSPTHSFYAIDSPKIKDYALATANGIPIGLNALLEFWHRRDMEPTFDGGVLEYSTDNGSTWQDILAGDGASVPANASRFLSGAYNDTIDDCCGNPLSNRDAWSGNSALIFEPVVVDLGDMNGETTKFRWRIGCDDSVADVGWFVDDVRVLVPGDCTEIGYGAWSNLQTWITSGGTEVQDENGDGYSNFQSYFYGFDPSGNVAQAALQKLPRVEDQGDQLTYTFTRSTDTVAAASFVILVSSNLDDSVWQPYLPGPLPNSNGVVEIPIPEPDDRIFFQLRLFE